MGSSPLNLRGIRRALLAFYDGARRDLPWRRTTDPYRIWISEVMLQQTRVEAVIPYYERWLERFPDVHTLAESPPDDVLKAWEGLGYYTRARNLHRAARIVAEELGGRLPREPEALRALPGVGDYTAGAVASIAYGARAAAVDGNVRRVLARLLDEPAPTPALLRDTAAALVPARRAGDFNQALMELGATICTPTRPACGRCAIARHCGARIAGTQEERPLPRRRAPVPTVDLATAVVYDADGRLLMVRRPAEGLLAGLWSFPSAPLDVDVVASAVRAAAAAGVNVLSEGAVLGVVEDAFTHRRERYHVARLRSAGVSGSAGLDPEYARFVSRAEMEDLALPTGQRRIAALGRRAAVRSPAAAVSP